MAYSTIDGDIADYIEAMELVSEYFTAELRSYLENEGHTKGDIDAALDLWRLQMFQALDPDWVRFELTPAGRAAVRRLRGRNLHP